MLNDLALTATKWAIFAGNTGTNQNEVGNG